MEKIVEIDGKDVRFRATAAVPRLYRIKFGRDIIQDLAVLKKSYQKVSESNGTEFTAFDLTVFENCAYIMAKHGDPDGVPSDIVEWMDEFQTFSIYAVLPEILELWGLNEQVMVESKKKLGQVSGS